MVGSKHAEQGKRGLAAWGRAEVLRRPRWVLACLMMTVAVGGACSLALDPNKGQCSSDQDCLAQGLPGSACVASLCQLIGVGPPDAGDPRVDAGPSVEVDASWSQDANVSPEDAQIADAAPPMCMGAHCPECADDSDCERRGVVGGTCRNARCSAPTPKCATEADCTSLGAEYVGGSCVTAQCRPNPRWACEAAAPPMSADGKVTLTVLVRNALSLAPVSGVRAVACQKLDLTCAGPVTETTTNAAGDLVFTVPTGFSGYLQVEDPKFAKAMYFLPSALPTSGRLEPFPLLEGGVIVDALALALGGGLDSARGHMMLVAQDCYGAMLPRATFTSAQMDRQTVQFYVRDLLPLTSARETGPSGDGGYLNFPAGTAVLNLKHLETGLDLATVSVVVRPGFISVVYIRPDLR